MYISTRGNIAPQTSAQAISLGMVPQGGLFVPRDIPLISWQKYMEWDYSQLALNIMEMYLADLPQDVLEKAAQVYIDGRFVSENPAPLVQTGNCGLLELWHGPTSAFKDMALQVLPYLLTSSLKTLDLNKEVLILTATSGDTGKAALEGFKDVPGTKIVVFYPDGGVSPVQEQQMLTTGGTNTFVAAIRGNFDECQTAVKNIFASEELRKELEARNMVFSSANSINWGRLLPQIVYYFWAYLQAVRQGKAAFEDEINIVVPTGNFGNILAAYYAKAMGLPLGRLICASNKNNVLADFFESGTYDINREFFLTSSPSMDILVSSNFERFLFEASGRDHEQIASWYTDLKQDGRFQVDNKTIEVCRQNMHAGWADEDKVMEAILKIYKDYGYLLDPHTAVGMSVYHDYKERTGDGRYTIIASTASPFKFAASVLRALDKDKYHNIDSWEALDTLSSVTGWVIPAGLKELRNKPVKEVYKGTPDDITGFLRGTFSKY